MHAVRWLHNLESRPLRGIKERVDESFSKWAGLCFYRGLDYDSVVSGFTQCRAGVFKIVELRSDLLVLELSDPTEAAYDLSDYFLHSPQATDRETRNFVAIVREAIAENGSMRIKSLLSSPSRASPLMEAFGAIDKLSWQLPSEWSFHGIQIDKLRKLWTALTLIGTSALVSGYDALNEPRPTWKPVLWIRMSELASCVSLLAGLSNTETRTILEWYVYDRTRRKSDIALTPFIRTGGEYVITSPELLSTSRFERNFYANAARFDKNEVDRASHLLEPHMARILAKAFNERGFQVATGVPFSSSLGSGDVDLLVWAPEERCILAVELKWFIPPADYIEVLDRTEKAERALRQQLPKYLRALSEDVEGLLRRAFRVSNMPVPESKSLGLVMRNHTGAARLRTYPFWFAPEVAFLRALNQSKTLTELAAYLAGFCWLPQRGKDFLEYNREIISPGGLTLRVPGYRILSEDPSNKPMRSTRAQLRSARQRMRG
jgi:hypothetical protein